MRLKTKPTGDVFIVCVFVHVCVQKYILPRKNIVDGAQTSLWNSIAFNSVAIFL